MLFQVAQKDATIRVQYHKLAQIIPSTKFLLFLSKGKIFHDSCDSKPEAQKERQASDKGNNSSRMQVHESVEPDVQFIVVSVSRTH